MNQQVNNLELKKHLNQMTNGMEGMVSFLKSTVESMPKSMSEEQAKEFLKGVKKSNLNDYSKKLVLEINNLKKGFDIV